MERNRSKLLTHTTNVPNPLVDLFNAFVYADIYLRAIFNTSCDVLKLAYIKTKVEESFLTIVRVSGIQQLSYRETDNTVYLAFHFV